MGIFVTTRKNVRRLSDKAQAKELLPSAFNYAKRLMCKPLKAPSGHAKLVQLQHPLLQQPF